MSRVNQSDYDVIVVGAGLIGAAFALLLNRRTSLKIAVVERSAPIEQTGLANQRVVALGHVAETVLRQIGVFEKLTSEHCYPYHRMFVWDENSRGELAFGVNDVHASLIRKSDENAVSIDAKHRIDCLGYMVDSQQCNRLLHDALQTNDEIDCYFNAKPESLELNNHSARASLLLNESQKLEASLVVAADGTKSWVRQQAHIFANHKSYAQQGIVANVKSHESHQDTAWQRFLSTGPVAILPLANNHSSIVWSVDDELADELMDLDDQAFCDALSKAVQGRLGEFELCSKRLSFALCSQRAEVYFDHNVVLIGDAAHSIHPLAGQGANLGFKDSAYLVDLLQNANPADIAELSLLQRYQRTRKADNEQMDTMMSALQTAFQGDPGLWGGIRGLGMNLISRSAVIKQLLARQAIGV